MQHTFSGACAANAYFVRSVPVREWRGEGQLS